MRAYIEEKKRSHAREKMKRGYQEMAQLNLALAQEHWALEEEAQGIYETALGVGQY
jgi:CopG family transcriptional regulator/antitoxin EndoAI